MYTHVTVIPDDATIIVDGHALVFPFQALPELHAVQWQNGAGHIEYTTGAANRALGPEDFEKEILPFVLMWEAEKARIEEETHRPPTPDELLAAFTAAIQAHLDDFARTRNYDGILSAATYATSTVPRFHAEGQYAVEARDATWAAAYQILEEVLDGMRSMPAVEDVITELPPLTWPEV